MNTKHRTGSVLAACCIAALTAGQTQAQPVGQWDFNNGDLTPTTGSLPLTYLDAATQTGTSFGTTTSFGIADVAGTAAKVMKFGAFTAPSGYGMPVSAVANGGGSLVNDWTLIMDVLYPSSSDKKFRALIETDNRVLVADADFFINPNDGVGISGIYNGNVTPDQWHRIALVVDVDNTRLREYVDGVFVGQQALPVSNLDGRWALAPDLGAQLFTDNDGDVAPGFVNSIQFRDVALTTGQVLALGGPAAAGIPATIPPVPAYLDSSAPAVGDTAAPPQPAIHVELNSGDSTVTASSVKLLLDDAPVDATVTPSGTTFAIDFQVAAILDPQSVHKVSVTYNENGTVKTSSYSFTVSNYQNLTLPTPFYLETFDELEENPTGPSTLPPGWVLSNQTDPQGATDYNLDSRGSLSYADWALVTADRFNTWGTARTHLPSIVLNGSFLDSLAHGNLMWAESDQRAGGGIGQFQELYTADIDCSGKTNVYVAWNSIYEQNQDNMDAAEYSIDGGSTWLPVLYLFCTLANGETSDILYKDAAEGQIGTVIDVAKTFARTDVNRPSGPLPTGTNYGSMIKAPISDALAPYMKGYINDDEFNGKRIEVVRLDKADGQKKVRFRFVNTGTSAWFWGIDDLGLYEINTPVINTQPSSVTVDFGGNATFKVTATAAQSYQWFFNGAPLNNQTNDTLTLSGVSAAHAGAYKVAVKNADGLVTSSPVTLTVIVAPLITVQPQPVLASVGAPVSFTVSARGKAPFTYQWQKNGTNIANAVGQSFAIGTSAIADAGDYRVIVSNDSGVATSSAVHLTLLPLVPIAQDLVVHFPFDNDANDTSGRGNNGTLEGQAETGGNPPTFPTTGSRIGTGFMHIADGQDVLLGQPDDLSFGADVNFTFSFWLKGAANGGWTGDPSFIGNKNWTDGGTAGLVVAAQGAGTFKENWKAVPGGRVDSASFGSVSDGNWHHVAIAHDRTGLAYYYLDGALKGTLPIANTGDIDSLPYYIGQDGTGRYGFNNDTGAHFLDIGFDDFGIWRRLLTPQEVASIYAHGLTGEDLTKASGEVVVLPPNVTTGPLSQVVSPNASVTLSVKVDGTAPFTYQWQKNGNPISTETGATLTINNFDASAAGDYKVVVTNSKGSSTSSAAHLAVSSAASLNQDLVAYLKFDGNYTDSSGRNNNATPKGPSPGFGAGKIGQAFHFITKKDGSVINYATLGAPTDLLFGTGDFTVSMWVSYSAQTDDAPFISNKDWGSSSNIGWGIFSQSDGVFRVVDTGTPRGGGNKLDTKGPNINDGNWHHILVSFWRGQAGQIYLDGKLVNTTPLTIVGSVDTADQGFAINIGQDGKGTYTDGGSASIDGLIDDVAIWRRVVTAQEDAAIYAAGSIGQDLGTLTTGGGSSITLGKPTVAGTTLTITWNGSGTFQLQKRAALDSGAWQNVGAPTTANSATDTITGSTGFYRVQKL
jgi:hypothetical protein